MSKEAYSYIKFSTPEQLKGDSFRRQLESSYSDNRVRNQSVDQCNQAVREGGKENLLSTLYAKVNRSCEREGALG